MLLRTVGFKGLKNILAALFRMMKYNQCASNVISCVHKVERDHVFIMLSIAFFNCCGKMT